jgi:hypothetical protein
MKLISVNQYDINMASAGSADGQERMRGGASPAEGVHPQEAKVV